MSIVVEAPVARTASPPRPSRTALAVARVEGRFLVKHPIFIGGLLLSVAVLVLATRNREPVLHLDDIVIAAGLLPLAGATFLVANLATLRDRRHDTEDLFESLPSPRPVQTLGFLLSIGWASGVALVLAVADVVYLKAIGGVWAPSAFELLTGPAIVGLAGALGIAMARWIPTVIAGLPVLAGVGALEAMVIPRETFEGEALERWFAPWVSADEFVPRELMIRPAGWHLLYLAAVVFAISAGALLRHGRSSRRIGAALTAVVVVAAAGWFQTRPADQADRAFQLAFVSASRELQVCRTINEIEYCAFRAYAPWIERWARVVDGVFDALPTERRPKGLGVIQRVEAFLPGWYLTDARFKRLPGLVPDAQGFVVGWRDDGAIHPGMRLGSDALAHEGELFLGLEAAQLAVGLPLTSRERSRVLTEQDVTPEDRINPDHPSRAGDVITEYAPCFAQGQARAAVAIWLAAQATPEAARALREIQEADPYPIIVEVVGDDFVREGDRAVQAYASTEYSDPLSAAGVAFGQKEAAYALRMLDRPRAEIAAAVARNWTRLTDPRTASDELVGLLDLTPLPTVEEQLRAAGLGPEDFDPLTKVQYDDQYRCS